MHLQQRVWPFLQKGGRNRKSAIRKGWKGPGYELAEAIESLGGATNPDVWKLTPRQITAYLFLRSQRKSQELAQTLSVMTLASRGDPKAVEEQIRKWEEHL